MSFHMTKELITGECGMVLTLDEQIVKKLRIRCNGGESGKYLHAFLGTKTRMTD